MVKCSLFLNKYSKGFNMNIFNETLEFNPIECKDSKKLYINVTI